MKRFTSVIACLVIFLFACNESTKENIVKGEATEAFDLVAVRAAIDSANMKFEEYFRSGDTASIAKNYTSDAVIYPPEMPAISTAELAPVFGQFRRMGIEDLNLSTNSISNEGGVVIELGSWEIFAANKVKVDHGKYLVIWKNVDGSWKMSHDVWNNSTAIPRAK